jgi:DNA-binding NarL/FixJ family response regulator
VGKKYGVFIVDREPVVRRGLKAVFEEDERFLYLGEAGDTESAIVFISELLPDLVIIDIGLKDGRGIELIRDIKMVKPDISILVFSNQDESLFADHILRAGANGYVMKDEQIDKIIDAANFVLSGEVYVSEKLRLRLLRRLIGSREMTIMSPLEHLSSRELEVFQLIGTGFSTRKIADSLHLGIKTVETYRFNIKKKLGIKDNTELIHNAAKWFINSGSESGVL